MKAFPIPLALCLPSVSVFFTVAWPLLWETVHNKLSFQWQVSSDLLSSPNLNRSKIAWHFKMPISFFQPPLTKTSRSSPRHMWSLSAQWASKPSSFNGRYVFCGLWLEDINMRLNEGMIIKPSDWKSWTIQWHYLKCDLVPLPMAHGPRRGPWWASEVTL